MGRSAHKRKIVFIEVEWVGNGEMHCGRGVSGHFVQNLEPCVSEDHLGTEAHSE